MRVCRILMTLAAPFLFGQVQSETIGDVLHTGEALPAQTTVTGSIDKARAAYASFLTGAADSPHRATALRRLADLELEAALRLLEAGESATFDLPIKLYRSFLNDYPSDDSRDHVLYQLSRALDNAGDADAALVYLQELTSDFEDSDLNAEALFRQGEMMFTQRDYASAAQAYAAMYTRHSDTRFETNARYKHGWSLFKTQHYAQAVERFAGLVDFVLDDDLPVPDQVKGFTPGQRAMFKDALRASSIALDELGGAAHLSVLLDSDALPPWSYLFYERLGEHYLSQERYREAAESFGAFANRVPTHAQAPILQARVIETYEAAGFDDRVIVARGDFVRAYGFDAPFWTGRVPAEFPEIAVQLNHHLESLTQHFHASAQRDNDPLAVDKAVEWYGVWLKFFPSEPQTPGRHFLLSELLFDAGRFNEAATEFERTAYEYPQHKRDNEAGYAALLARDKAYAHAVGEQAPVLRQFALDSKLRFADGWPEDPRAPAVLLKAAEELYAVGVPEDAIVIATRALLRPDALSRSQQRTGWVVRAHAQFDLARFDQAESAYQSAIAATGPTDALIGDLQDRLSASVYERGRVARESGDLAAAAGHFLRVGDLGFDSPVHPVALYDASAALINLQSWDDAALALDNFRLRYPQHELASGIAEQITGVYLQGNRPLDAAAELSKLAESADADTATAARWQAAKLYADNADPRAHLNMLQTLAGSRDTPVDQAMRAREQLVMSYQGNGDAGAVAQWREDIISADAAAGASRSDYSRTLAARAALALAVPLAADFDNQALTLPLQRSIPAKTASLESALAAFRRVADYAIDETSTAATFYIAELYRKFGAALMDSQRPPELDELALEEYELLLEEQAFPFEEKAIELHEVNTARAASRADDARAYDEWIASSYEQLAVLLPARYNKVEHRESLVTQLD